MPFFVLFPQFNFQTLLNVFLFANEIRLFSCLLDYRQVKIYLNTSSPKKGSKIDNFSLAESQNYISVVAEKLIKAKHFIKTLSAGMAANLF